MDDPRLLRIILFGLVLAALTIGYLIFSGKFLKPQTITNKNQPTQTNRAAAGVNATPVPTTIPGTASENLSTPSAYTRIMERNQGQKLQAQANSLPKTGLPIALAGAASVSAITVGWFLRKYPK